MPPQGWYDGKGRKRTGGGKGKRRLWEGPNSPSSTFALGTPQRTTLYADVTALPAPHQPCTHRTQPGATRASSWLGLRNMLSSSERPGQVCFRGAAPGQSCLNWSQTPLKTPRGPSLLPKAHQDSRAPLRPHQPPLSSTPIAQALPLWWHPALLCSALSIGPCDHT